MTRPVQVLDSPILHPGQCFKCKSSSREFRRYWIDTGIDIDWEGVVYICDMCMTDIVRNSPDFYTQAEMDSVVNSNNDLLQSAKEQVEKGKNLLAALKALGFDADFVLEAGATLASNAEAAANISDLRTELYASNEQVERLTERLAQADKASAQTEDLILRGNNAIRYLAERDAQITTLQATIERMAYERDSVGITFEAKSALDVFSEAVAYENLAHTLEGSHEDGRENDRTNLNLSEAEFQLDFNFTAVDPVEQGSITESTELSNDDASL